MPKSESDEIMDRVGGDLSMVGMRDQERDHYHDELEDIEDGTSAHEADGHDTTSSNSTDLNKINEVAQERLAQRETRHVLYLRLVVCLILLAAALAVSLVVYRISMQGEQEQFELQFQGAATKVTDAFLAIANERLGYAGALVVAIVDHALNQEGDGWPFVTLSSFQRRAATVKDHSSILSIGINPIVQRSDRAKWENYTLHHPDAVHYYNESIKYEEKLRFLDLDYRMPLETDDPDLDVGSGGIANRIYDLARFQGAKAEISPGRSQYLPDWLLSPLSASRAMINQDRSSNSDGVRLCLKYDTVVFEGLQQSRPGYASDDDPYTSEIAWLLGMANNEPALYLGDLFSTVYLPLYNSFETDLRQTVGVMRLILHWAGFFRDILPSNMNGLVFVLENQCTEPFTYILNGPVVEPIGVGDLHDPRYDAYMQTANFRNVSRINDGTEVGMALYQDDCPITIRVYPSQELEAAFHTSTPAVITIAVACVFLFAIGMFFVYDRLVERRQKLVLREAEQTSAIVSSLFPKQVRDRMMEEANVANDKNNKGLLSRKAANAIESKNGQRFDGERQVSRPIADLFPAATVLFSDIAGFRAWSSSRDPTQVFILLQSIYQAFDKIAAKRKVFKVETIGDSYLAVTGLPQPQALHAVIMARFAGECLSAMRSVVQNLYTELGPDTAELTMRFGIHSGPVTAGVLMGDRARFQLFGDTVNTAARMESTGVKDRIQATKATADLLIKAGKQHWVQMREDQVHAKGLGVVTTYWITPWASKVGTSHTSSTETSGSVDEEAIPHNFQLEPKESLAHGRLVDWMTELFKSYVKDIVAKRAVTPKRKPRAEALLTGCTPLDEVVECLILPEFNADSKALASLAKDGRDVVLDAEVCSLLREYVSLVAGLYRDNPFHNFAHACHVTMAASKFMKRITTPDIATFDLQVGTDVEDVAAALHDYTHGIHGDPISLFGIVFSALIHDVDHLGVSNAQLATENPTLAERYKHKSVAEQNSLDMAWNHLMSDRFRKLRDVIFATPDDFARFRRVVVNVVLATDIFDKELNDLRKSRWNKAFSEESLSRVEKNGLRATIVIEHIIQASDVSHTMQHWHVYRKWNHNLFHEMTLAYRQGRMAKDPVEFWYRGELGFFDNYVIPLAKKLKECNVFGVSSDECLNYAIQNREEWQRRGEQIVAEMAEEFAHVATQPKRELFN